MGLTWLKCDVNTHKCNPCVIPQQPFTPAEFLFIFLLIPLRAQKYTALPLGVMSCSLNAHHQTRLIAHIQDHQTAPKQAHNTTFGTINIDVIVLPYIEEGASHDAARFFLAKIRRKPARPPARQ